MSREFEERACARSSRRTPDTMQRVGQNSIHHPRSAIRVCAAASILLLASGCSNLGYYWQSMNGQLDIWRRERPVEEVIADPATPEATRTKLARVLEIRDFASRELGLPENRSYRNYADLERSFVVWNVFAVPEFSVQPLRWCFPVAGCVSYRGYFSKNEADRFAAEAAAQGHDVYVGGVPAYSTLGYFADPVLNTIIHYSDVEIARLLFHELAHQAVYAKDDSAFNESFAVAVEREGVRRWLAKTADTRQREAFERNQRIRGEFVRLIGKFRGRLDALYRSRVAPEAMRERKRAILAELETEYRALQKGGWGGFAGYDFWFQGKPNNAQIASVAIYSERLPVFEILLKREGGDLTRFYAAARQLAALPKEERDVKLRELAPPVGSSR